MHISTNYFIYSLVVASCYQMFNNANKLCNTFIVYQEICNIFSSKFLLELIALGGDGCRQQHSIGEDPQHAARRWQCHCGGQLCGQLASVQERGENLHFLIIYFII